MLVVSISMFAEVTIKRVLETTCIALLSLEADTQLICCQVGRVCCRESVLQGLSLILINWLNDNMDTYPIVAVVQV